MRLTKAQIEEISRLILMRLKGMDMVAVNAPEDKGFQRIVGIFTRDLMGEDELDKEVRRLLDAYESEFKSGKMEYMKMFNKVKENLIKERDMII